MKYDGNLNNGHGAWTADQTDLHEAINQAAEKHPKIKYLDSVKKMAHAIYAEQLPSMQFSDRLQLADNIDALFASIAAQNN